MFDGPEPIYHQIAQMIRAQVLSGELAEEDQVMSTTQFATTFRINPATAQKAFGQLVDEQVLYRRRGLGTFVAPGARDRLLAEHRARFFDEVLAPALTQADLLGIAPDDVVAYIRDRRTAAPAPTTTPPPASPASQEDPA